MNTLCARSLSSPSRLRRGVQVGTVKLGPCSAELNEALPQTKKGHAMKKFFANLLRSLCAWTV